MRRQLGALRPANAWSEELLAELPQGKILKVVITQPRNLTFHNKFFALLSVLYPHQSYYPTMRKFRKAVLIALGYCEETTLPSGKVMVEPDSMAWNKMEEPEFDALMKRFFELAETRILPGISHADVKREWEEVMRGYNESGVGPSERAETTLPGGSDSARISSRTEKLSGA